MANNLKKYNEKRDFKKTKEPRGKKVKTKETLRFCVQHHEARRDHYDFRLEWNGVLKSWAVPKGPSYNPKDKRLAVKVEDHPLSYCNFEGTIPKGEYGGGAVMLWDEGIWEPLNEDFDFEKKELKFILHSTRLKGAWTLIPFKENNWLLIKENDKVKGYRNINEYNTSIKTGRTMNEIKNNLNITSYKNNLVLNTTITSPNKTVFKNPKINKMDIVKYYHLVSKRMLPYLENRLISTIRMPDGYGGTKFFKKHFSDNAHNLGKKVIKKNEDYYYIKDVRGLISEVQMNSFEFHIWGSNINNLNKPNFMVFDLDPDEKLSLKKLREGVKDLKKILDDLKLKSFLKTSGGKGYHVIVPIKSNVTWQKFRKIAEDIAELMEAKWPEKYTSNIRKENRKEKIFIDYFRNTKGATSVAPYSIRLRKKCTVSMPIAWSELDKVKPDGITMEEALKRLKRKDPWAELKDCL